MITSGAGPLGDYFHRNDLSVVTGMTCTADPHCEAHPDEDCPDPGATPALTDMDSVITAYKALLPWQHMRMLHFLVGYDTDAVARAVRWVRDGERD